MDIKNSLEEKILSFFWPGKMRIGKNYITFALREGHGYGEREIEEALRKIIGKGLIKKAGPDAFMLPEDISNGHEGSNGNDAHTIVRRAQPESLPHTQKWERRGWKWPSEDQY